MLLGRVGNFFFVTDHSRPLLSSRSSWAVTGRLVRELSVVFSFASRILRELSVVFSFVSRI